jgi:proteasome accessory factor C
VSDPRERLRRLLLLVPYAAREPGVTLTELAQRLGVDRKALLEDLDLLAMVGRPPFSPDDFIDLYVEGDRVRVVLDQRFSRPPRLTAPEAAALWASAQVMRPAAKSALGAAQKKLLAALPASARKSFGGLSSRVGAEASPMDELLEPLARAAREMREVELVYLAAGRRAGERRAVRPYAVYLHRGHWYLAGYCLARKGDRLFRVDRISALEVTARRFQERKDVKPQDGGVAGESALVRFTPAAAPFVRERFPDAARTPEGGLEVELSGATPEWLVPYVLSFGGEAQVVRPEGLRQAVLGFARRALADAGLAKSSTLESHPSRP